MRKLRVLYALGLTCTLLAFNVLSQPIAMAGELNGFRIHTQDKSVTITLLGDQAISYNTERRDHQLTITLPDTKLSKKLLDEGLPVVIDDQNRFIGRAVPTADGKVKIIIPNLPAEGYAVSIHQQHGSAASSGTAPSIASSAKQTAPSAKRTPKILPNQSSIDSVLKPRSAVKTDSKQAFDQVLSRLPSSNVAKQMPLRPSIASAPKLLPPKTILDKLNNPSPMMLSTVEPSSTDGKRPGTIWNPYVVKIDATPKDANTSQDAVNSTQLYPRSEYNAPPQNNNFDPYAHLHHLGNESGFNIPSPPSFSLPNILPGNFHAQAPVLPTPIKSPLLGDLEDNSTIEAASPSTEAATPAEKNAKASSKTTKNKLIVIHSKNSFIASIPEPIKRILRPIFADVNWIWFAIGLCLSGIGLFCLLGSAVLGRLLFTRNLGFISLPQPLPSPLPDLSPTPKITPPVESPLQNQLNQRRPIRGGLGFQDVAIVNALDYSHRSTSSVTEAVRHNPFRERFSARTHARPKAKSASTIR